MAKWKPMSQRSPASQARYREKKKRSAARYKLLHPEKIKAYRRAYNKRKKQTPLGRVKQIELRAKQRGVAWGISMELALDLVQKNCHYCGSSGLNGIDRLAADKGYYPDNVATSCGVCNVMKHEQDYGEFQERCVLIADRWRAGVSL